MLEINSDVVHGSHFKKQQVNVGSEPVFHLRIFSVWKMNGNPRVNFKNLLKRELLIVIS